jgi:hypothetical protein
LWYYVWDTTAGLTMKETPPSIPASARLRGGRAGKKRLWPFHHGWALAAMPIILAVLVVGLVLSSRLLSWPAPASEGVVLTGALILSVVPLGLSVLDVVLERGGTLELAGIKLNIAQVAVSSLAAVRMPTNIGGTPGQPISDSDTSSILDSLRQASSSDVIIIDLGSGGEWWETRLLVLLAGAVRLRHPEIVVFVAADGGVARAFQGWARPDDLFPLLLAADPRYARSYWTAIAAASQWALDPPPPLAPPPPPPVPFQGLAAVHSWMRYLPGTATAVQRNDLAAEQALAADLGATVEMPTRPVGITIDRLTMLFRPVLRKFAIDETHPGEKQLEEFLESSEPYVVTTRGREYQRLVSRATGLNAIVRSIIDAWPPQARNTGAAS